MEERKSKFNGELRVVRTLGLGTYIQADGLTQSGGIVETFWRQTLRRVRNEEIKNCLILGLGGGTVAKLVRKFWPDAKITGVDIDPMMIALGKKYLGLDRIDVEIKIADAYKYLKNSQQNSDYDLVVIDTYSGDQFPADFETEQFLSLTRGPLLRQRMVIFNRLYYGDKRPEAVKFGRKLEKIFPKVEWYYPEANLMFVCTT